MWIGAARWGKLARSLRTRREIIVPSCGGQPILAASRLFSRLGRAGARPQAGLPAPRRLSKAVKVAEPANLLSRDRQGAASVSERHWAQHGNLTDVYGHVRPYTDIFILATKLAVDE